MSHSPNHGKHQIRQIDPHRLQQGSLMPRPVHSEIRGAKYNTALIPES